MDQRTLKILLSRTRKKLAVLEAKRAKCTGRDRRELDEEIAQLRNTIKTYE